MQRLGNYARPQPLSLRPSSTKNLDKIMEYVFHVHLPTKKNQLQVRVGQGKSSTEKLSRNYPKWVTRMPSIQMAPMPEFRLNAAH